MADIIDVALADHASIRACLHGAVDDHLAADLDEIRSDRACAFGRWLDATDGARTSASPEYARARAVHARFHHAAFRALVARRLGRIEEARHSISSGEFEACALALTDVLGVLRRLLVVSPQDEGRRHGLSRQA